MHIVLRAQMLKHSRRRLAQHTALKRLCCQIQTVQQHRRRLNLPWQLPAGVRGARSEVQIGKCSFAICVACVGIAQTRNIVESQRNAVLASKLVDILKASTWHARPLQYDAGAVSNLHTIDLRDLYGVTLCVDLFVLSCSCERSRVYISN